MIENKHAAGIFIVDACIDILLNFCEGKTKDKSNKIDEYKVLENLASKVNESLEKEMSHCVGCSDECVGNYTSCGYVEDKQYASYMEVLVEEFKQNLIKRFERKFNAEEFVAQFDKENKTYYYTQFFARFAKSELGKKFLQHARQYLEGGDVKTKLMPVAQMQIAELLPNLVNQKLGQDEPLTFDEIVELVYGNESFENQQVAQTLFAAWNIEKPQKSK